PAPVAAPAPASVQAPAPKFEVVTSAMVERDLFGAELVESAEPKPQQAVVSTTHAQVRITIPKQMTEEEPAMEAPMVEPVPASAPVVESQVQAPAAPPVVHQSEVAPAAA